MAETETSASRDRDETETLTIFLEARPRRDVGTSRNRDHNPVIMAQSVEPLNHSTRCAEQLGGK